MLRRTAASLFRLRSPPARPRPLEDPSIGALERTPPERAWIEVQLRTADPGALPPRRSQASFVRARGAPRPLPIMRTTHVKASDVDDRWLLFDASKHNLGRMAAKIAFSLIGKDRPTYTPSESGATHIVVIHSATARFSGKKSENKQYKRYSGFPSGLKFRSTEDMREMRPNEIVRLAVRRMLPKGRLGQKMLGHLKVYPGADHPHSAQRPVLVEKI